MIICLAGTKGGSGRSTTATNFACIAAGQGADVLLVDADDFAHALRILNAPVPPELELDAIGEYAQSQCPKCGSLETSLAELTTKISYPGARLGLPIPLKVDGWKCDSCGNAWPESSPGTAPE